ncbi:MAG: glycosyltransferase family 4 protein [Deltaproteobacteria bacterium]|nr:glycosyltransferase family 4 protein [Deltaproteobacteria bacterium]
MNILTIHNFYIHPGGEDFCVSIEASILINRGNQVKKFKASNAEMIEQGKIALLKALYRTSFNHRIFEEISKFCREKKPDIANIHNSWFALSPAIHAACHAEGVPTVQTLHNFRLLCVNALLMRNGEPCEDCVGKSPWLGVLRRCYHGSALHSAFVARMIQYNRKRGTWDNDVDVFIALTECCRQKFIEGGLPAGGLPANKIMVKPNFVEDPVPVTPPGKGAVFVGRLSPEKGVRTLLSAWQEIPGSPLNIIGEGPLRAELEGFAGSKKIKNVRFFGQRESEECYQAIRQAAFLILPSVCYENFPRAIVESFACGRPVVASRLGSMAELVEHGRTGLLFEPGNAEDLAEKVRLLLKNPDACREMGLAARREYEEKYTPERNYEMLMEIYETAIRNFKDRKQQGRSLSP